MKLSLGLSPRDYSVAGGAVAYDTDAQAYFTANTAITSSADKNAINDFYLGLKSDGIYTKLKVMYLPIWGSASASKWNLINPLDTDAAFRATFATGFTYSNTGITGNGTSAYVDTYYIPSSNTTQNSAAYGIYSRTNRASGGAYAFGVTETSPTSRQTSIRLRQTDIYMGQVNDSSNGTIACTDTRGFFQVSRITSTNRIQGINNTFNTVTSTSAAVNGGKIFVMARNPVGFVPAGYDTVEIPFFYAASGLTQTEMSNFYTRVNTLMTYFGINV